MIKRSLLSRDKEWHVRQEVVILLTRLVKLTVKTRASSSTRKLISTLCKSLKVPPQTPSPQRQLGCTITTLPSATTAAARPPPQCSASSKTPPSSNAPVKAQPGSKSDRQLALRRCPPFPQMNCSNSNRRTRRVRVRRPYRTIMMSSCTRRSFSTTR